MQGRQLAADARVENPGDRMSAARLLDDVSMGPHDHTLAFLLPGVNRTSSAEVDSAAGMTPGERLRRLREAKGLSAAALGARVGRSESAVRNQENNTNGIPPGLAAKYAHVLGTTAGHILYGDEAPAPKPAELAMLPVLRRVQAGAWLAVEDFDQDKPRTEVAARDPRFPAAEQWLSEVVGDSMNALDRPILEGDMVHCVSAQDIGYFPQTGHVVEVERLRFQGREAEVTLKQVEVTDTGVLLWPRSTNPRWQDPIALRHGIAEGEEIEVRIRGLVLSTIRRF